MRLNWGLLGTSRARVLVIIGLVSTPVSAAEFLAPNGSQGAGLSTDDAQKWRAYMEGTAFYRSGEREIGGFAFDNTVSAFPVVLGAGYKVIPELELEMRVPVALGWWDAECDFGFGFCDDEGGVAIGNLYMGANYLMEGEDWLLRVGGAIAWGPWTNSVDADSYRAYALSATVRLEELYLYNAEVFNLLAPARFEYRALPEMVLSADAWLGILISTAGNGAELHTNVAPGVGYVAETWTAGGRIPVAWSPTDGFAQFALEPYARFDFDRWFVNSRFTLNLDDPFGFSFSEGRYWAFHLGFGASF